MFSQCSRQLLALLPLSRCSNRLLGSAQIAPPPRVERGPTDLLKAIASTVDADPTAAKYKYQDDPFFIPATNVSKRNYALSKEAGKKAARWLAAEYPTFFMWDLDEPRLSVFRPEKRPENESEAGYTEADLKSHIAKRWLNAAVMTYENIKKQEHGSSTVSAETKQALLEFLCFCNAKEPEEIAADSVDWTEERYFREYFKGKGGSAAQDKEGWLADAKANALAQGLFEELTSTTATASDVGSEEASQFSTAAYSAMICGLCRHGALEEAMLLFAEMKEKGLRPSLAVFNSLLRQQRKLEPDIEKCQQNVRRLLEELNAAGFEPTLATFNNLLANFTDRKSEQFVLRTLREMIALGISVSPATCLYVLQGMDIQPTEPSRFIAILNLLEKSFANGNVALSDVNDCTFFSEAMRFLQRSREFLGNSVRTLALPFDLLFQDLHTANRLMQLVKTHAMHFLCSEIVERDFFASYLRLVATQADPGEFFKVYDSLVPHTVTPDDSVMRDALYAVEKKEGQHERQEEEYKFLRRLPSLWSDCVAFGRLRYGEHTSKDVVNYFMDLLIRATDELLGKYFQLDSPASPRAHRYCKLVIQMAEIGWDFKGRIDLCYKAALTDTKSEQLPQLLWNGYYVGVVAVLCARAGKAESFLSPSARPHSENVSPLVWPSRAWEVLDTVNTAVYQKYQFQQDHIPEMPLAELLSYAIAERNAKQCAYIIKLASDANYSSKATMDLVRDIVQTAELMDIMTGEQQLAANTFLGLPGSANLGRTKQLSDQDKEGYSRIQSLLR